MWGGAEREQCYSLCSLLVFSHSLCYPQVNWALLVLIPRWVGLCTFWDPAGLSNEISCEAGSFSRCRLNPQGVFNQGFEASSPRAGALVLHGLFRSLFVPPSLSPRSGELDIFITNMSLISVVPTWHHTQLLPYYCLYSLCCTVPLFYVPHVSEVIQLLPFSVWLISLSKTLSRPLLVVVNGNTSSFLMAEWDFIICVPHVLSPVICWKTLGWLPCLGRCQWA